ncbi:MAG: Ribosomal RNA small subunit methyltransferase B [Chlamydiae bacterium]|nr:Ribosomal RNA small subunit methyltransferase B [Chlamydiota bacterium]
MKTFGEEDALKFAHKSNRRAPLTIRVNAHKISRDKFIEAMKEKFPMECCEQSSVGIRLREHVNLFQTEEFKNGWFEVQDEASQLAAFLVEVQPKQKILDYCAGSGGKSLALAPLMNQTGCIYLHDIRSRILQQAKKRFKRAGIFNYQIMQPASKPLNGLRSNMDWVLVDAPCTGTGTYRRNPDLKWKFDENMLQETVELQRKIFEDALKYLKPKGRIVYLTCSMLKDENEKQVEYFIQKHGLKLVNKPLNSALDFDRMDGFYGAVLTRT